MAKIHPSAVVDPKAELADDVEIGPLCYVEAGVVIGAGTKVDSHATIKANVRMGERNFVGQGAVIGGDPQDRKFDGSPTFLVIGDDNVFREYVTLHRATGEGKQTTIGHRNYLMAFVHVAHNCTLHDDITIANNVGIAGHSTVESLVNIGGMTGLHQFVHVGRAAFVAGMSRIVQDAPPFMITGGMEDQVVYDINAVGLRRIGITQQTRLALHKTCKLLYKSKLGFRHALEIIDREVVRTPEVDELIAFAERSSKGKNGRQDQP